MNDKNIPFVEINVSKLINYSMAKVLQYVLTKKGAFNFGVWALGL
jgi:hypothetical protein